MHVTSQPQQQQQPAALATTATRYPRTHDKIQEVRDTPYFIDNKFVASRTDKFIDLADPATNHLVTRVPQMTDEEMRAAVASAERAFRSWKTTTVLARQQIMFRFVQLIRDNWDRLAASITLEQGKTFADAKGDVLRGLQVAEHAIGAPDLLKGEVLEVAKDMETRTYREPLGVVAAICPFSKCHRPRRAPLYQPRGSSGADEEDRCRLPGHDTAVVHPDRHHHRQHADPQAVGA